jgi:hypothetical protein
MVHNSFQITSFGGRDLQKKHPKNARVRSHHLPIHPSNPHPDNGSILFLKDNALLPRNSYIKTKPQRTIKSFLLRPSRYQTCTLTSDSYNKLVKYVGFKAPPATFITTPHMGRVAPLVSRVSPEFPDLLITGSRAVCSEPIRQSYDCPGYSSRPNELTPLLLPLYSSNQPSPENPQTSSIMCKLLIFAALCAVGWWLWEGRSK